MISVGGSRHLIGLFRYVWFLAEFLIFGPQKVTLPQKKPIFWTQNLKIQILDSVMSISLIHIDQFDMEKLI